MRIKDKLSNYAQVDEVIDAYLGSFTEEDAEKKASAKKVIKELKEKVLRDEVLERGVRLDGRAFDEIRPIWAEGSASSATTARRLHAEARPRRSSRRRWGLSDDQQKIETVRRRDVQAVSCCTTLPAVLGGRSGVHARPGPSEIGQRPRWPSARWRR